MAYVPTVPALRGDVSLQTLRPPRRGFFRKLVDAMMASQQRRADIEIARYLRDRGGRLNDETEREIERRFLHPQTGGFGRMP